MRREIYSRADRAQCYGSSRASSRYVDAIEALVSPEVGMRIWYGILLRFDVFDQLVNSKSREAERRRD